MGDLGVKELLKQAVRLKIGSGMAASYGNLQGLLAPKKSHDIYVGTTSHLPGSDEVGRTTFFDLSSLTKILATTTLAMSKYQQGFLDLDQTLSIPTSFYPIRLRDLLTHSSGMPAWKPIYQEMAFHFWGVLSDVSLEARRKKFDEFLWQIAPENWPGKKVVYSDIGILMLEKYLSKDFQADVESLWSSMGIEGLHYRPILTDAYSARLESLQKGESIAATELCPWRGLLVGQVHDDNTWSRGGVSSHSGVFGRLKDIKSWLRAVFMESHISKNTLEAFTRESVSIDGTRRALGFDMPSIDGSGSTAFSFSKNTVGHLGFTGTSVWVDLDSGDYAILLTNRVHPSRDDIRIRALRREFHRLVRS